MGSIYFDIVGGASGDMLLAGLVNLGCPLKYLRAELKKININFKIKKREIEFRHLKIFKISFSCSQEADFSYKEILRLVTDSRLKNRIKTEVINTYTILFDVERKIHRIRGDDFKFHHLGKIDAILEIVGFYLALDYFGVDTFYVSPFPVAQLSPASLELLKGKKIKVLDREYEAITPTAAALLRRASQTRPLFSIKKYAFSLGDYSQDDYLTVYLIENIDLSSDTVIKIEATIDDMNPQIFETLFEKLYNEGVKEAYIESVIAKKSRPAFVLNVLCLPEDFAKVRDVIFSFTSTFGLRYKEYNREKLNYKFVYKNTKLGQIRFRVSLSPFRKETPEYEDCVKISRRLNIPLLEVYRQIE